MSVPMAALSALSGLFGGSQSTANNQGMGESNFLQLLITELQNQDPTQPMDPTQQASQLAQFSSLEQMQNLNIEFNQFAQVQEMAQGASLIGKNVAVLDQNGNLISGPVQLLQLQSGSVMVQINNQLYPMSGIVGVG